MLQTKKSEIPEINFQHLEGIVGALNGGAGTLFLLLRNASKHQASGIRSDAHAKRPQSGLIGGTRRLKWWKLQLQANDLAGIRLH